MNPEKVLKKGYAILSGEISPGNVVKITTSIEVFAPILMNLVSQLFAYYMTVAKGYNVDQPRNLAKSVTVE